MDCLIDLADDIQWLKDVFLNTSEITAPWNDFKSAIICGNMDSPYSVKLFIRKVPLMVDDYLYINFVSEPVVYCGLTDKPLNALAGEDK